MEIHVPQHDAERQARDPDADARLQAQAPARNAMGTLPRTRGSSIPSSSNTKNSNNSNKDNRNDNLNKPKNKPKNLQTVQKHFRTRTFFPRLNMSPLHWGVVRSPDMQTTAAAAANHKVRLP